MISPTSSFDCLPSILLTYKRLCNAINDYLLIHEFFYLSSISIRRRSVYYDPFLAAAANADPNLRFQVSVLLF